MTIPKAEGDSSLLGQRPFVFCRLSGPRFVWPIFRSGSALGSPIRYAVPVKGFLRLMLGMPLLLTLRRFLATLFIMIFISSLQMLSNLLTRWIGSFLTVPLGGLVFLPGFVRSTSLSTGRFGYGLSSLLVSALLGRGMGAFPKAALLVWSSSLRFMPLGVGTWSHLLIFLPNSMLIISSAPLFMLTLC